MAAYGRFLFVLVLSLCVSLSGVVRAQPTEALLSAVKRHDIGTVRKLLAHGAAVDARDSYGATALIYAALLNQPALVKLLVAHGASVDAHTPDGITPLMAAARGGAGLPLVNFLIAHGANVNATESDRTTVLHYAAQYTGADVVHVLVRHGAAIDAITRNFERPLTIAAQYKRAAVVRELVKDGADGAYALTWETYGNRIDSVRLLLDSGVDVNSRFDNAGFGPHSGTTALIEAGFMDSTPMTELLLSRGADPNAVVPSDENMTTALMMAAYHCNADMIRLLAAHGAVDRTRANDRNAYDLASTGWTNTMQPCDSTVLSLLSEMQ